MDHPLLDLMREYLELRRQTTAILRYLAEAAALPLVRTRKSDLPHALAGQHAIQRLPQLQAEIKVGIVELRNEIIAAMQRGDGQLAGELLVVLDAARVLQQEADTADAEWEQARADRKRAEIELQERLRG